MVSPANNYLLFARCAELGLLTLEARELVLLAPAHVGVGDLVVAGGVDVCLDLRSECKV